MAEVIRYEIALGVDDADGAPSLMAERILLKPATKTDEQMPIEFPRESHPIRESLLTQKGARRSRTIVSKARGGNDTFRPESSNGSGKRWAPSFKLGPMKSALENLPEDESAFPASTWLKRLLIDSVQPLVLNSRPASRRQERAELLAGEVAEEARVLLGDELGKTRTIRDAQDVPHLNGTREATPLGRSARPGTG